MSEVALSVRSISKTFVGHLSLGRRTVVRDLSLEVRRGEIYGFLGGNGAGKTTTIKMIVGLIFPDRGSVEILGVDSRRAAARRGLGFLPENPYFHDYLTAEEFLRYYGRLYGLGGADLARRVRATLERVGLADQGGTALRKFSKGMVQRVGVAQAILADPALVILDEPMSGLDPIGRRDVRDILLELKGRGTTLFFSSHILQDAEMICDRVGILSEGRLVKEGTLGELLRAEASSYEVLVSRIDDAQLDRLGVPVERLARRADGQLLRVAEPAQLRALVASVLANGGHVEQVTPQRSTLEDLFIRTSTGETT